jgi:hypothetical protein
MTRPGYVIAAEIDSEGNLTGNAEEVPTSKGDELWEAGTHTTFGTWKAFRQEYAAQQSSE